MCMQCSIPLNGRLLVVSGFDHWEGDCSGTNPTTTVLMDLPNKSCNAIFNAPSTLNVSVNPNPNQGRVTSDPPGIDCPAGSCSTTLQRGASITLTATPQPGFVFDHWEVGCSGTSPMTTLVMDAALKRCDAFFAPIP